MTRAARGGREADAITSLRSALVPHVPPPSERDHQGDFMQTFAFSDSIIIRSAAVADNIFGFSHLWEIANICYGLPAKTGLFVRGGVAWGKFYADDYVLFSPALIAACRLEERAKQPRVLVDETLAALPRTSISGVAMPLLVADVDGAVFVNYLIVNSVLRLQDQDKADAFLLQHKEAILRGLSRGCRRSPIRAKYRWLRDYHNAYCQQHLPTCVRRSMLAG